MGLYEICIGQSKKEFSLNDKRKFRRLEELNKTDSTALREKYKECLEACEAMTNQLYVLLLNQMISNENQ